MAPPKFLADLEAVSSDSDSEDEDRQKEEGSGDGNDSDAKEQAVKKQRKDVTLEDLQKAGYKSGPSVLVIRPPGEEQDGPSWAWGDGRDRSRNLTETEEERLATQRAVTEGTEAVAREAQVATAEAERRRQLLREEREEQAALRKAQSSWSQKEKRKRDEGKQSRGKSYVEEEKRLQRQFGVYSGFDT